MFYSMKMKYYFANRGFTAYESGVANERMDARVGIKALYRGYGGGREDAYLCALMSKAKWGNG